MGNRDFHYHYDKTNNFLFYRQASRRAVRSTLITSIPVVQTRLVSTGIPIANFHQMVVDVHT